MSKALVAHRIVVKTSSRCYDFSSEESGDLFKVHPLGTKSVCGSLLFLAGPKWCTDIRSHLQQERGNKHLKENVNKFNSGCDWTRTRGK